MKTQETLMLEKTIAVNLRIVMEQQKLIKSLKYENYIHMRDKVMLQDQILARDLREFTVEIVDNSEKVSDKW